MGKEVKEGKRRSTLVDLWTNQKGTREEKKEGRKRRKKKEKRKGKQIGLQERYYRKKREARID